jgi:RNA polymerase sigma factor (sigma-70 family)
MVLLRFVTALPRIDPERGDQYLATVVQNVLRTEYRRRAKEHRRYVPVELSLTVHAPDGLEAHAEYEELARALARATQAALPLPLRDVFIATLRGERVRDIAARQQVNPVTVRTRLSRARAILRGELAAFLDDKVIPAEQSPRPSPPRSAIAGCCGSTCPGA